MTANVTPVVEEIIKAAAVLYFALCFSDDRDTLRSLALAIGLGFALLENMVILTQHVERVTIPWALARAAVYTADRFGEPKEERENPKPASGGITIYLLPDGSKTPRFLLPSRHRRSTGKKHNCINEGS